MCSCHHRGLTLTPPLFLCVFFLLSASVSNPSILLTHKSTFPDECFLYSFSQTASIVRGNCTALKMDATTNVLYDHLLPLNFHNCLEMLVLLINSLLHSAEPTAKLCHFLNMPPLFSYVLILSFGTFSLQRNYKPFAMRQELLQPNSFISSCPSPPCSPHYCQMFHRRRYPRCSEFSYCFLNLGCTLASLGEFKQPRPHHPECGAGYWDV